MATASVISVDGFLQAHIVGSRGVIDFTVKDYISEWGKGQAGGMGREKHEKTLPSPKSTSLDAKNSRYLAF